MRALPVVFDTETNEPALLGPCVAGGRLSHRSLPHVVGLFVTYISGLNRHSPSVPSL
jgi:hypothetical protein